MSSVRKPVLVGNESEFARKLMQPHTPERFRWLYDRSLPVAMSEREIQKWLGRTIQDKFVKPRISGLTRLIDRLAVANRVPLLMHAMKSETLAEYVLYRIVADADTQTDLRSTDGRTAGSPPNDDTYIRCLKTIEADFPVGRLNQAPDNSIEAAVRQLINAASTRTVERSLAVCERLNIKYDQGVDNETRGRWLVKMLHRARAPFGDAALVLTAFRSVCDRVDKTAGQRRWQRMFRRSGHPLEVQCLSLSRKYKDSTDYELIEFVGTIIANTKGSLDAALNRSTIESDVERLIGAKSEERKRLTQKLYCRIQLYLGLPHTVP